MAPGASMERAIADAGGRRPDRRRYIVAGCDARSERSPNIAASAADVRSVNRGFHGTHLLPQPVRNRQLRRADRDDADAGAARHDRGRDPPSHPRAAQHRLLRAQAPLGDRDHDGRGRGRARRVRCVRHRLLLRPRPDAMPRAREHPGDRPARSIGHAVAPVRPLVRGRHRSPQGGARAARSGAPVRARGQLPLRRRHRLVRHRHGARPADRREGHVRQGPGRDAHARAPRPW